MALFFGGPTCLINLNSQRDLHILWSDCMCVLRNLY